ncbi:VOC family protein [Mucilaginibacter psychrotolerans]|uniref:VOC family protein n=1 Tax=Mucilaginibacter psychrotolerans TaxID=1524096 RepID=A0A4Y8S8T9_9SPHI|nr:VOC family protein [Mucilaginibacter psychrotolerans]TFF35352.1 VOC family protein [Mucilaginibacter psychrotolerans]
MSVSHQKETLKASVFKSALIGVLFCLPFMAKAQATFNHAALCSANLKVSNKFYTTVLQLKIIPNPFQDTVHTWYSIGPNLQMHIIQANCPKADYPRGVHLCFSVPSIPAFIERLNSMNIPYTNWKGLPGKTEHRVDGVNQIYINDPDGYLIEINDAK